MTVFGFEILEPGELSTFGVLAIAFGILNWAVILGSLRRLVTTSHVALATGSAVSAAAVLIGLILILAA